MVISKSSEEAGPLGVSIFTGVPSPFLPSPLLLAFAIDSCKSVKTLSGITSPLNKSFNKGNPLANSV